MNWHKFDRHRGMPKKPFRKDAEAEDESDHMDYFPDNSDEEARQRKEDDEYIRDIIYPTSTTLRTFLRSTCFLNK